jgi:DNA-binding transcriptional LysR family regulator
MEVAEVDECEVSRMLDTQLQIFKCVVERESFSLAAQELHMTQSSISQQIHSLECYYGVKLFDRLHRRIVITQAGKALYPFAVKSERLYQEAEKTMRALMDVTSGRLDIGASFTVGEYLLPDVLVQFNRLYPLVDISMTIENSENIIGKVNDSSLSLGCIEGVYEPTNGLTDISLRGDCLVIVAPPDRKGGAVVLPFEKLIHERWVMREPKSGTRRVFEQFIRQQGYKVSELQVVMELSSTEAVKRAVKAGCGLGVVSCLAVGNELKCGELAVVPIQEGVIARKFTLIYHRDKFQTLAVEKFISFMKKNMQE